MFQVTDPDYQRSPYSGMTRRHWIECGRYLLGEMFAALPSPDAPLVFPKRVPKSYPQADDPPWKLRAQEFEGLVRSLNLVAPLLEEDPGLTIGGIPLADYYLRELRRSLLPGQDRSLPRLEEFPPSTMIQMTCELGGLAVIFLLCPLLWHRLEQAERDEIAALISSYAHGYTGAHNWRYFNVMMFTFLRAHGYAVDERIEDIHLNVLQALYAGDGWFRDLHFDYYNAWVFHLYAPIWCAFGGYQLRPELAARLEKQTAIFAATYPRFFARDGSMLMWGRSAAYRMAAASPLPAFFRFREPPTLAPGWARRIGSGNLLQFVSHPKFLSDGVPALGFHGAFEPAVQHYSCAASPMWLHLTFLSSLSLPAEHPYWTDPEAEGDWEGLTAPRDTVLAAPGICLTNYPHNGTTEIRCGKIEGENPNYSRLAFHTAFPWEEMDAKEGMAMHYSRETPAFAPDFVVPARIPWIGARGPVLYRQVVLSRKINGAPLTIDLADVALPHGILRIDRPRVYLPGRLRLGHYALPHLAGPAAVEERVLRGCPALVAKIPGRQVALVAVSGWDRIFSVVHRGFNAEAEESTLLLAERQDREDFAPANLLITLLLHKTDDSEWTDEELLPIREWSAKETCRLTLNDGRMIEVDFAESEGRIQL